MTSPLVLKPRLSEKAYALSEARVYIFDVPKGSNAQQVAQAVNKQFSVSIDSVRLSAAAAKTRKTYKKRGQARNVTTAGFRKAYVTLKEGDSLPFFVSDEPKKKSEKEPK